MKESVLSFEKKQKNICFPTFKLPARTKSRLRLIRKILFLTSSVNDNQDIGPSSVVYILHKGIIAKVLCGYEVQMKQNWHDS